MTETAIKAKIMAALKGRGFFFRAGAGPYSRSGVSDILGVYNGRFVAIEVKTPEVYRGKLNGATENQARFHTLVEDAGGFGRVVASVQGALDFLDHIDWVLEELNK